MASASFARFLLAALVATSAAVRIARSTPPLRGVVQPTPPQGYVQPIDPPLLTAKIKKSPSVAVLAKHHSEHAATFNSIHYCALWARAGVLARREPHSFHFLEPAIAPTVELANTTDFGRLEIAGTAHGLAKARLFGGPFDALWTQLEEACVARIDVFTPRELATATWSFAKRRGRQEADSKSERLFDALASAALPRLSGFTPQGLTNVAWAFATVNHPSPALLEALAAVAVRRAADFNSQELANLAWAYASLGRTLASADSVASLFEALAASARPRLQQFSAHELALLGWAYAIVDVPAASEALFGGGSPYAKLAESQAQAACRDGHGGPPSSRMEEGTLTMLHQWALWRFESGVPLEFSASFAARCRSAFFASPVPAPSSLELSVQAALASIGLRTQQKVRTAEGYLIDLHVETLGGRRQVALEVDGPSRFVGRGRGRDIRGATWLKRRQLRHFSGQPVITIPWWEWEELGSGADKAQYLSLAFAVRIGVKIGGSGSARKPMTGLGAPLLSGDVAHRLPAETLPPRVRPRQPLTELIGGSASSPPQEDAAAELDVLQSPLPPLVSPSAPPPPPPQPQPSAPLAPPYTWTVDLCEEAFGDRLERADVCAAAAAARLVIVGEVYAKKPIVEFECAVLRSMLERCAAEAAEAGGGAGGGEAAGGVVHLVLEHFNVEMQYMLDDFMEGRISFVKLLEEYALGDEGHDLRAYAPLLLLARAHASGGSGGGGGARVRAVGGFLPRAFAKQAVQDLAPALEEAAALGYVRPGEDCAASEAHYNMFEGLVSGRNIHDSTAKPTGLARRLFPAQVIKGCSMAHAVNRLVDQQKQQQGGPFKALVICGASHMAYGHGVPERVFAAHPSLQDDTYRIYAREADAQNEGDESEPEVLTEAGLRGVFGTGTDPADAAFVFQEPTQPSEASSTD